MSLRLWVLFGSWFEDPNHGFSVQLLHFFVLDFKNLGRHGSIFQLYIPTVYERQFKIYLTGFLPERLIGASHHRATAILCIKPYNATIRCLCKLACKKESFWTWIKTLEGYQSNTSGWRHIWRKGLIWKTYDCVYGYRLFSWSSWSWQGWN